MSHYLILRVLLLSGFIPKVTKSQTITQARLTTSGTALNSAGISLNFTFGELVIENLKAPGMGVNTGLFGKENEEGIILPITLKDFKLVAQGGEVKLVWSVTHEANILSYELEKSTDGRNFSKIVAVSAGQSNITNRDYSFVDYQFIKKSYYRLKIVEADKSFSYSSILTATALFSANKILIFPNPAKNLINLNIKSNKSDTAFINITNSSGAVVISKSYSLDQGENVFALNVNSLIVGNYFITIRTKEHRIVQVLIKL